MWSYKPLSAVVAAVAVFGLVDTSLAAQNPCLKERPEGAEGGGYSAPHQKKGGEFPTAAEVGGDVFIPPLGKGAMIPKDIPIETLDGKPTTTGRILDGDRPVVLNFFLLFSPRSVDEMKSLQELSKANSNVQVIGINIGNVGGKLNPESAESDVLRNLRLVAREAGVTYPIYSDTHSYTVQAFGLRNAPTTFLLDKRGMVKRVYAGPQLWISQERLRDIREVIGASK